MRGQARAPLFGSDCSPTRVLATWPRLLPSWRRNGRRPDHRWGASSPTCGRPSQRSVARSGRPISRRRWLPRVHDHRMGGVHRADRLLPGRRQRHGRSGESVATDPRRAHRAVGSVLGDRHRRERVLLYSYASLSATTTPGRRRTPRAAPLVYASATTAGGCARRPHAPPSCRGWPGRRRSSRAPTPRAGLESVSILLGPLLAGALMVSAPGSLSGSGWWMRPSPRCCCSWAP